MAKLSKHQHQELCALVVISAVKLLCWKIKSTQGINEIMAIFGKLDLEKKKKFCVKTLKIHNLNA